MAKFHRDWKVKRTHGVGDHVPFPHWRIRFYLRTSHDDDRLLCHHRAAQESMNGMYQLSRLHAFGPRSACCVLSVDMLRRGITRLRVTRMVQSYYPGLLTDVHPMRYAKTWPNSAAVKERCDADAERHMLESAPRLCPRKPLPTQSPEEMYPAMMCKPECIDPL